MLKFLWGEVSDRKIRLFTCACCGRVCHLLRDERSHCAIQLAERIAEGETRTERRSESLAQATDAASEAGRTVRFPEDVVHLAGSEAARSASFIIGQWDVMSLGMMTAHLAAAALAYEATAAVELPPFEPWRPDPDDPEGEEHAWKVRYNAFQATSYFLNPFRVERNVQSHLLRDLSGNPFRPAAFDPSWRTNTVVALARQMYETRDFGPMPILADALQDAGCEAEGILAHCREPGVHVRGCHVVDLILGKG
jgi:hypothetical protein